MTYSVSFTDATNPAKPSLTVPDGALNQQTPVTFPGKNYSGYAKVIAEDFLHLLENFANSAPPANPVQGQLWFDTANNNNTLKVYDGTNWNEAGNLKKTTFEKQPSIASSVIGDLWVDLTNSQLYLFSGSSWLLVGPQYAAGLATGPIVENITDSANIKHPVISMFAASAVDNVSYRIAIISKDSFTPKAAIDGFLTIKEGINLYSPQQTSTLFTGTINGTVLTVTGIPSGTGPQTGMLITGAGILANTYILSNISGTGVGSTWTVSVNQTTSVTTNITGTILAAQIWGTADTANSLIVNSKQVPASNFLTTDGTTSTTSYPLNIQNAGGLSIGSDLSFNLFQGTSNYTFSAKNSGTSIDFSLNSGVVLHIDSTGKIGIGSGTTTPASALAVTGVITATGGVNVTSGNISASGGLTIGGSSVFSGTITTKGQTSIDPTTVSGPVLLLSLIHI